MSGLGHAELNPAARLTQHCGVVCVRNQTQVSPSGAFASDIAAMPDALATVELGLKGTEMVSRDTLLWDPAKLQLLATFHHSLVWVPDASLNWPVGLVSLALSFAYMSAHARTDLAAAPPRRAGAAHAGCRPRQRRGGRGRACAVDPGPGPRRATGRRGG